MMLIIFTYNHGVKFKVPNKFHKKSNYYLSIGLMGVSTLSHAHNNIFDNIKSTLIYDTQNNY